MKSVRYRRGPHSIQVRVEAPGPKCAACGGAFEGRRRNTHHWKEEYTFKEVKEDPPKALDNSIQVCVPHHRVANAMREIVDAVQRGRITSRQVQDLVQTMPEDMRVVWDQL